MASYKRYEDMVLNVGDSMALLWPQNIRRGTIKQYKTGGTYVEKLNHKMKSAHHRIFGCDLVRAM